MEHVKCINKSRNSSQLFLLERVFFLAVFGFVFVFFPSRSFTSSSKVVSDLFSSSEKSNFSLSVFLVDPHDSIDNPNPLDFVCASRESNSLFPASAGSTLCVGDRIC